MRHWSTVSAKLSASMRRACLTKGQAYAPANRQVDFELFIDVHLLTIMAEKTICRVVLNLREELKGLLKVMEPACVELYS